MEGYSGSYESGKDEGVGAGPEGAEVREEGAGPHNPHIDTKYVQELNAEKTMLDHETFPHSIRLVSHEINRVTLGGEQLLDLFNDKPTKVSVKVRVPVLEYPKFNFIGKLLGPKGNTLKRLQDETGCRMAVYGRGSMRDKDKEEELRQQGGKYAHLTEDLHVFVECYGHPIDVYRRISMALYAVRRHLVPDYNDDITQNQVQELAFLNGRAPAPLPPRTRGGHPPPHGMTGAEDYGMGGAPFQRPPYNEMRGGGVGGRGGCRGESVPRGGTISVGVRRGGGQYPSRSGAGQGSTGGGYNQSSSYEYGLSSGLMGGTNNNILGGSAGTGGAGNEFYNNNFDNFTSAKSSDPTTSSSYGHMGR